jgi:acetyl esterase
VPLNDEARALLDTMGQADATPIAEMTLTEIRTSAWGWLDFMTPPEPVAHREHLFIPGPSSDLPIMIYAPSGAGPFPALVYFHGGGFVVGNIQLADGPSRRLANATGCVVIAVNYQKAPEHSFPIPLDDCAAAFQWAVEHAEELDIDPQRVGVVGDSAGGNLAAAVCLKARDEGTPLPAVQVLIYPVTSFAIDTPSAIQNAEGYGLSDADMRWYRQQYLPDEQDRRNPLAAPLLAPSLEGLPPAVVVTAEFDPLCDEGDQYADRLESAGVPVIRRRYAGTIHGFFYFDKALSEGARLVRDLSEDLPALLGAAGTRA